MVFRARTRAVLLAGSGPLADAMAAALARGRRRFVRVEPEALNGRRLKRAEGLLVAASADSDSLLARLRDELTASGVRRGPLRVVLVSEHGTACPTTQPLDTSSSDAVMIVERVDVAQRAARVLLARWPLHLGFDPRAGQQPHLLIAGRARPAEALLAHALRLGVYSARRLLVSVVSTAAQHWEQDFAAAYPQAHHAGDVRFLGLEDPTLSAATPVSLGYVFPEPSGGALTTARTIARRLAHDQAVAPPLMIEVGDAEPDGDLADWDGQLIPISYRRAVLAPEVLLDGRGDALARVIHEHYRDTTEAQGRDPSSAPAGQPWPLLAESYRNANRHQADHIWAKLAVTDCRAVPDEQVEAFAFAPAEVESLAVIEHARWAADRWLDGWSYAPVRDNQHKHHPQLVPFEQLSGPMQDLDRYAARLVPTLLARSGLGVQRMLVVAIEPGATADTRRLSVLAETMLRRLVARFPDRSLIIATALNDSAARCVARLAVEHFDAGLFLLVERSLPELLAGLGDEARALALSLIARAERRIPVSGPGELERWIADRAEVQVVIGARTDAGPETPPSAGTKQVQIGSQTGLAWGFEY